jgi:CRP-like cAMP-binding protein
MDGTSVSSGNRLLAALPPGALSTGTQIAPELGAVLQESQAPITQVYFPIDGLISLVVRMRDGSAVETGIVGHEGGEGTTVVWGCPHAFTTATVQVTGRFVRVAASDFVSAYRRSEEVRMLVDRYNAALFFQSKQLIACNAVHAAEARLARWLLQVRDRIDRTRLPLTHEFLAQMLAVRRTTVTEVLGGLQSRSLVRQHRGAIEILDAERLQQIACECYTVIRAEQGGVRHDVAAPA